MNILVDENVPQISIAALRAAGHDVMEIRGTQREGDDDDVLWKFVKAEGRMFITTDKGFRRRRAEQHHGILVVRLHQPNAARIHEHLMQAMKHFSPRQWPGMTVVMRDKVQSVWRKGH